MKDMEYCSCCGRLITEIRSECIEKGQHDKTCNSYVYGHHEYFVKEDELYTDGEILFCEYCGTRLDDEDFRFDYEHHEFWGAPCTERMLSGYYCHVCDADVFF